MYTNQRSLPLTKPDVLLKYLFIKPLRKRDIRVIVGSHRVGNAIRELRRAGFVISRGDDGLYSLDESKCAPLPWIERKLLKYLLRKVRLQLVGTDVPRASTVVDCSEQLKEVLE